MASRFLFCFLNFFENLIKFSKKYSVVSRRYSPEHAHETSLAAHSNAWSTTKSRWHASRLRVYSRFHRRRFWLRLVGGGCGWRKIIEVTPYHHRNRRVAAEACVCCLEWIALATGAHQFWRLRFKAAALIAFFRSSLLCLCIAFTLTVFPFFFSSHSLFDVSSVVAGIFSSCFCETPTGKGWQRSE